MAEQPIVMNVPDELLRTVMQAAILKALPLEVQSRMVETIVHQALTANDPGGYGRKTVMQAALEKMLCAEAAKQCQEWVEEQRPVIAKRIREELKRRNYADRIFASVIESLGRVKVSVSIGDDR